MRPQPLLPGHVQVIRNHVRFDGWDGKEPCGKTTFTPDTECPPDRGGLGWQVDRTARKRHRSIYPDNGRRPKAIRFTGPIDTRTTQSSRCGVPGFSEGSDSAGSEPLRPDRRPPRLHYTHPNHHDLPHPRRKLPPPLNQYESMGGGFMPALVFPSAEADHAKPGDDSPVGEYSRKVAWYSGPVMITKGPFQPRDPTAREVDRRSDRPRSPR